MKAKACAFAVCAVLIAGLVAGCGKSIPKTKANLAICAVLAKVLDHEAPLSDLTDATLLNNNPITPKLRQDMASYVGAAVANAPNASKAAATAKADCASIGA
jgi:hypothetical protein